MSDRPLVSIVTPFYNTDAYLAECIESVLLQSYPHFEYILIDNHSTDRSPEIAASYAARDPRIRVVSPPSFLGQVQNYNFSVAQIAPSSRYCKVVQADDWIFPNCVAEMVALAEENPNVGIVSAYEIKGNQVFGGGLPPSRRVLPGAEACRLFLVAGVCMFGSPTTLLYRADVVRERTPFFEEGRLHEDTEAVFEILAKHDFGFVHQVLTFTRVHADSITGNTREFAPDALDRFILVKRFGHDYLDAREYESCFRDAQRGYYGGVVRQWMRRPPSGFWKYQKEGLETVGETLRPARVARHAFAVLLESVVSPSLLRGIKRLVSAG